jgi:hypothetical protein
MPKKIKFLCGENTQDYSSSWLKSGTNKIQHHEHKGTLSHLGFNGDCDAPVYLTKEVVDELAEQIEKDYADYPATDGFFWGQQFQEESVKEYKEQDIKFLKFCQQAIDEKKVVEYWCSW